MNSRISALGATAMAMIFLVNLGSENTMLFDPSYSQTGEPFYVEQLKSTAIRILDVTHGPKVEISFAGNGTINGTMNVTDIGTIWIMPTNTSENTLYSEGQGILTTQQGKMVTYTQQATGQITPDGMVFQGSMFFKTLSPTGQLAFLNNQMGIYNYESDLSGNAVRQVWEWR